MFVYFFVKKSIELAERFERDTEYVRKELHDVKGELREITNERNKLEIELEREKHHTEELQIQNQTLSLNQNKHDHEEFDHEISNLNSYKIYPAMK